MEVNVESVKLLIEDEFRGNESWFAEEIGVNRSYLNLVLNKKKSARSFKICLALITFCKKEKKDCGKYINFF